ncbi:MAG: hypothetical protein F6K42_23750 [Leptolyngbya sp. SIO1D8]|nr:hypothetical protein [Leptolyngbya sp. SIO1D8]
MNNKPNKNDLYMKIWEAEQKHVNTRWTVTTFFLSISFAIFGISLQVDGSTIPIIVPQLVAVSIYWFTYVLFLRFKDYTNFLRSCLVEIENAQNIDLDLQAKAKSFMKSSNRLSVTATQLLFYFGLAYTVAGFVIGFFFW